MFVDVGALVKIIRALKQLLLIFLHVYCYFYECFLEKIECNFLVPSESAVVYTFVEMSFDCVKNVVVIQSRRITVTESRDNKVANIRSIPLNAINSFDYTVDPCNFGKIGLASG